VLDEQLPDGPWKARLEVTSGLLTETAQATITFPTSGTGPTVPISDGPRVWWWTAGGLLVLGLLTGVLFLLRRGRNMEAPPKRCAGAPPSPPRADESSPTPRRKALMHRHELRTGHSKEQPRDRLPR
jgi:hypothetical protein